MYRNIFLRAGLTPTQASILDFLFEKKQAKASKIAKEIKKSRAITYRDLEQLVVGKVVEKIEKAGQVSVFRIGHPSQLEKFFDQQENKAKKEKELFQSFLPDMVSSYNLINNKPGVRYYEGLDGITKALKGLAQRLKPESEIVSFTKVLEHKSIPELDKALADFIKKRIKKNVKTRVITFDTEEGGKLKNADSENLRETRLISRKNLAFDFAGGEIFIYENTTCFITAENNTFFAFVVENKAICQLLKALFESEWLLLAPSAEYW